MGVARDLVLDFVESMHKVKSPAPVRRILPKKWRKSSAAKYLPQWKPEGGCLWSCKNGQQLTLRPVTLLTLTEVERLVLQKIAQAKLQAIELGCPVPIPKDWNSNKRAKKSTFPSLRKRTASTSALENTKGKESGWVFGIPLGKCIANEVQLRLRKPPQLHERRESLDFPTRVARQSRKLSNSSGGAISSDSLSESDPRSEGSNLLDALSLSSSSSRLQGRGGPRRRGSLRGGDLVPHIPQIPYVVTTCCKHLQTYGLRVLGIFRIGSSKKRSKQLREELDTGQDIKLNDEHNPHDVAAILKEYFRDLPDPLMTRDLYSAFVAVRRIKNNEHRLLALHLLVSLLPTANRDTLWALLLFLNLVVQHSTDVLDEHGQELPGNKMDSTNLATLFGPNLLHKAKGGEFQVESLERAEERKEVIAVIKELIDKQSAIFQLQPETQDTMYRLLLESHPEAVDFLMKRHLQQTEGYDPEISTSGFGESDGSSMPHSLSYINDSPDLSHQRAYAEVMQVSSSSLHPPHGLRHVPSEGQLAYTSTPLQDRYQSSPDRLWASGQKSTLLVPPAAGYGLLLPESGFYHNRSVSPASPRVSPSPKAMKPAPPEIRGRVSKSSSPDKVMAAGSRTHSSRPESLGLPPSHTGTPSPQVRRSVGVPHGPGPGSSRSRSQPKHSLSVPGLPRAGQSKSGSCSSLGSSGYHAGSSRSGTSSPMSPDTQVPPGSQRWYLHSPPDSPKDDDSAESSPFYRTSSTQRPLGISVQSKTLAMLTSPSPLRAGSSPPIFPSGGHSPSSTHLAALPPRSPPRTDMGNILEWQKERWKHWEKLAKQHSEEFHEQETLV